MSCSRRDFLKGMGACFAGGFLGRGNTLFKLPGTHVSYSSAPRSAPAGGNIVVFVQLYGGNDGINMVYPLNGTQRTNYESFRPTLKLPISSPNFQPWIDKGIGGNSALDIGQNEDGNSYALNPGMGALYDLYTSGKVAMLPGVHYPSPNHSHFESTNVYTSADPSGTSGGSGFFGKYLNSPASGYAATDVPTVILGDSQSPLFTPSTPGIFTFSYLDVLQFPATDDAQLKAQLFNEYCDLASARDPGLYPEMVKIAQTAHATVSHLTEFYNPRGDGPFMPGKVQALLADGDGDYNRYNPLVYSSPLNYTTNPKVDGNDLATDLKHVAAVIRADVGARFFHVGIGGFDTHSEQEKDLYHSSLLNQLSEALAAFYSELNQTVSLPNNLTGYKTGNLINNVLVVTFSEFGRTIRQNATDTGKAGTDHASSAPQFVMGGQVMGGQYGMYPQFDDPGAEAEDDLKLSTDFRDVFGTVLNKWLDVPAGDLGPAADKLLTPTPNPDADGKSYTTFTPLGFL